MQTKIVSTSKRGCGQEAAEVMRAGGVVAYPTETSYALGCDATNFKAIGKIYALKGRDKGKPLPVIVGNVKIAEKYAVVDRRAKTLARKFMPGPLTLLVEMHEGALPSNLSKDGMAFRVSASSFARSLSLKLGAPVVSTSANTSGEPSIYSAKQIVAKYFGKIDFIADGGELAPVKASTIVDLRGEVPVLVREGTISLARVMQALKQARK